MKRNRKNSMMLMKIGCMWGLSGHSVAHPSFNSLPWSCSTRTYFTLQDFFMYVLLPPLPRGPQQHCIGSEGSCLHLLELHSFIPLQCYAPCSEWSSANYVSVWEFWVVIKDVNKQNRNIRKRRSNAEGGGRPSGGTAWIVNREKVKKREGKWSRTRAQRKVKSRYVMRRERNGK